MPLDTKSLITEHLAHHRLTHGVGTAEAHCSMAAINLALSGRLTDKVPDCMSEVIGRWIIPIQDAMPLDRLNGPRWRALLPLAAGTGRDHEAERLDIIMDWMWGTVLPQLQPIADERGFGAEWARMCTERTAEAAWAEAEAAEAALAAKMAAWARASAELVEARAALAAARAALAAARAALPAAKADVDKYWDAIDPEALLERLIAVGGEEV